MRLEKRIVLSTVLLTGLLALSLGLFGLFNLRNTYEEGMRNSRNLLNEQYDRVVREHVDVAIAVIEDVHRQELNGELTPQEARQKAAQLVRTMRYDQVNYLWIDDYEGVNVVLPPWPEREGKNRYAFLDAKGIPAVQLSLEMGRQPKGGYFEYWYQKPGEAAAAQKRAYVRAFPPYRWVVGTGVWTDAIEREALEKETAYKEDMERDLTGYVAISLLGLLLTAVVAVANGRRIAAPIRKAAQHMRAMAEGKASLQPMQADGIEEVRELSIAFNQMAEALEKRQTELRRQNEELSALYEEVSATEEALHDQYKLLVQSEERYRLAMDGANDILWDWDINRDLVVWSDKMQQLLGVNQPLKTMKESGAFVHPEDLPRLIELQKQYLRHPGAFFVGDFRLRTTQGYRWFRMRAKALWDTEGKPLRMAGSLADITEEREQSERIWRLAYNDALTGLINRVRFREVLDEKMQHPASVGGLLYFDLDNFKEINDTFGHPYGDRILQLAAERLAAAVPPGAVVARIGGDEFTILLETDEKETVAAAIRTLQKVFLRPFYLENSRHYLTFSMGVAYWPVHGATADALTQHAELALYEAKEKGKNMYRVFDSQLDETLRQRRRLEAHLREAILRDELFLAYQPQVGIADGKTLRCEALLRWNHQEDGVISPAVFIPLAEKTGLIISIGYWVLERAAAFAVRLSRQQQKQVIISVNISAMQLAEVDFVENVGLILAKTGLPAAQLELEITESVMMFDWQDSIAKLRSLRELGVTVALDDFGTGYSSLNYLQQLPIDVLKVDRSFIKEIGNAGGKTDVLSTILALAHTLSLQVVAEGVETEEQATFLKQKGCDFIQGYFYSRPLEEGEYVAWIARRNNVDG